MRFGNGLPRQSVPQGHLLRGADWLAMTGFFDRLKGAHPYGVRSLSVEKPCHCEAVLCALYSMSPLSFSRISISVPLIFLMAILSISFSAKDSGASLMGFLSMA